MILYMDQYNLGDSVMFWLSMSDGQKIKASGVIVEKPDWNRVTVSYNTRDEKNCPISGMATISTTSIISKA